MRMKQCLFYWPLRIFWHVDWSDGDWCDGDGGDDDEDDDDGDSDDVYDEDDDNSATTMPPINSYYPCSDHGVTYGYPRMM